MENMVTLDEEQLAKLKATLNLVDNLVTSVISGKPGQQTSALAVARALSDLQRSKMLMGRFDRLVHVTNKP